MGVANKSGSTVDLGAGSDQVGGEPCDDETLSQSQLTERSSDGGAISRRKRVLDRVLLLAATATAITFLVGLVVSLVGVLLLRHPYIGYTDNIVADAEAVATGHLQYGNPATQFVGFPYTPLFTWLFAGLLKIYWWDGWGSLISMVAALTAMVFLVRMLWETTRRWESRVATASFVVALSLGGLSALPIIGGFSISGLYDARPDQLAWCLLVVAGTLMFRGFLSPTNLSQRKMLVIGLLLAGSVCTKQTTLVPSLVIALALLVVPQLIGSRPARSFRGWLRSGTALLTFVAVPLLLGIGLQVASHGYAYDILVNSQFRYVRVVSIWQTVGTSLRVLTVPLAVLVVLALCVTRSMRADRERYQRRHVVIAILAVVLAVSPIPTAILAEAKLGGELNQLTGPVWTITLGCAVLLLLLRPSTRKLAAAVIACGVLLVGIHPLSQVLPGGVGATDPGQHPTWTSVDPFLLAASNMGEAVFDQSVPSLSVSPDAPKYPAGDINDSLAEGYTPRWLINNLLTGRYALVSPLGEWLPGYASDEMRYDQSVVWKINLLLKMGYTKVKEPKSGAIFYRPSSRLKHLGWFAKCFGPYQAPSAGVRVRLRERGGLVCINSGRLHLSNAYWPVTDFVMTMAQGKGEATVRFAAAPHALRVTPLDGSDQPSAPVSDMLNPRSAVARCLTHEGSSTTLTIRAIQGRARAKCLVGDTGPVLNVPDTAGGSTAHVAIQLAFADSPTIVATSSNGRSAPFVLLNPTPGDINSL